VVQGVSERVTRDNARRVARRVVDHLFGSEP
jgi:hypothetical protein